MLDTLRHIWHLASYGIGYRAFTEHYLDSYGIFKDVVLAILAVIAKQGRVRLSERTVAGLEKARKAGRIGGRPKAIADRGKILELIKEGVSTRQVGLQLGISAATVSRITRTQKA